MEKDLAFIYHEKRARKKGKTSRGAIGKIRTNKRNKNKEL